MTNSLFERLKRLRVALLSRDTLCTRFAKSTFWSIVGTAIEHGLRLVSSVIVARFLGRVGFGELGMLTSTVGTLGVLAGQGLGLTATKHVAELRIRDPQRAGSILGLSQLVAVVLGGLMAGLLFTFAPFLATQTLNAPHLVGELRLGCGLVFLTALVGAQTGALAGLEAFRRIAQLNLARGLLNLPAMVIGVWLFGLRGLIGAMIAVQAIGWLMNELALRQECHQTGLRIRFDGAGSEWRVLWTFSLPAFLSGLMAAVVVWLTNTLLANQPEGYGELGLLNAANQWRRLIMSLPVIFSSAALPIMSAHMGMEDGSPGFGKVMHMNQRLSILIVVPLSTLIMFLGDWIMRLYGRDFSDGTPILLGIVLGMTVSAIGNATGSAIQAKGKMWFGTLLNLSRGAILLGFVLLGSRAWGARSYALGTAVAYLLITGWSYAYLRKDLPSGMLRQMTLAVAYISFIALVCLFLTPRLRLFASLPAVLVSIFVSSIVSQSLSLEKMASIRRSWGHRLAMMGKE